MAAAIGAIIVCLYSSIHLFRVMGNKHTNKFTVLTGRAFFPGTVRQSKTLPTNKSGHTTKLQFALIFITGKNKHQPGLPFEKGDIELLKLIINCTIFVFLYATPPCTPAFTAVYYW